MLASKGVSACANRSLAPRLAFVPTIGDNIKRFRLAAGFEDQGTFADKLGVPQSSVSRWETNVLKPSRINLVRIAVAVNRSVDDILDEHANESDLASHTRTGVRTGDDAVLDETDVRRGYEPDAIPVIAEGEATPAGMSWTNTIVRHVVIEYIARPHDVDDPDAYGLLVIGDSMQPTFRKGHRLVVSPNTPIDDGDEVYVQLKTGERLIKLAFRIEGGWRLESINPAYGPKEVKTDDVEAIHAIAWAKRKRPGLRVVDEQTGKRIRS